MKKLKKYLFLLLGSSFIVIIFKYAYQDIRLIDKYSEPLFYLVVIFSLLLIIAFMLLFLGTRKEEFDNVSEK